MADLETSLAARLKCSKQSTILCKGQRLSGPGMKLSCEWSHPHGENIHRGRNTVVTLNGTCMYSTGKSLAEGSGIYYWYVRITCGKLLLEMIQCSVTTVSINTIDNYIGTDHHLIQSMSHYSPGQRWMGGDEVRNNCLFALPITGILSLDIINFTLWYVYILTKHIPQPILHAVQYT